MVRKKLWDGWIITDKIGEGRYGEVYKAVKKVDGVTLNCAIKYVSLPKSQEELNELVRKGAIKNVEEANNYYLRIIDNLKQEIAIMQRFNGNPYVIDCFDYIQESKYDGTGVDFYIRMELAEDIDSYYKNRKISEDEVIKLAIDICSALELCSSLKIIHKDVKPSNIYIGSDGKYKLGDFGIAAALDSLHEDVVGTYNYMSPEVYNKKRVSYSTDLYSLGIVMYKLLNNNKLPFYGKFSDDDAVLKIRMSGISIPPIKGISKELMNIISKACCYEVSSRYNSASEMKRDLLKIDRSSVSKEVGKNEKTLSIYDAEEMSEDVVSDNKVVEIKSKKILNKVKDLSSGKGNLIDKFRKFELKKSKKIIVLIIIILLILLLLYGCVFSKNCEAGYVNKYGSCVKGYYYCDDGYSLNDDNKCQKATDSVDARVDLQCGDSSYVLNGEYCVKNDTKEPKSAYQCTTGFTLNGDKCVMEEQAAPNASYSCSSGYTLVGSTCAKVTTQAASVSYSCPSSKYTLVGSTCSYTENNSSYIVTNKTCSSGTYNSTFNKCCVGWYCSVSPTETKSCSKGTYNGNTCVIKNSVTATTNYKCSAGYELVGNQCVKTEQRNPSVKLSCATGYTLRNNICYASVSVDAVLGYTCDKGYVFTGVSCVANSKVDAIKKYSCSKKYTLNGDKCEKYDIVRAKIHYDE